MANQIVQPPMPSIQIADPQSGKRTTAFTRELQKYADALNGTNGVVAPNVSKITLGTGISQFSGSGSPEGIVPGNIGDQYMNTAGGASTTLWIKTSGVAGSNTGWTAK